MRILVATDAWRPQVNGVVRSLETMAQSARALGAEIDFLTPRDFNSLPMPTYPEIALALASPRAVRRRLEDGYDHVHIATEGPIGLVTRAVLLRARRCFTTSFHTRFPEYIQARFGLPVGLSYAALRRFHNAGAGVMVSTPSLLANCRSADFGGFCAGRAALTTRCSRPTRRRRSALSGRFSFMRATRRREKHRGLSVA